MVLRRTARAVTRLYDHCLTAKGLTTTQYAILGTLAEKGDLPLTELADHLGMDRTSLYRTIVPVENAGWVSIRSGRGRAKAAHLTTAGLAARNQAQGEWANAQERVLGELPEDQWNDLLNTLNKLIEAASA
jgi:DNA-binding MarR family transcriptional regulator